MHTIYYIYTNRNNDIEWYLCICIYFEKKVSNNSKYSFIKELEMDVKGLCIISKSYNTTPITGLITQRYRQIIFFIIIGKVNLLFT